MVYYYHNNNKHEYFYNLKDLKHIAVSNYVDRFVDTKRNISIDICSSENLLDRTLPTNPVESDIYFDYEPSGYKVYEDVPMEQKPSSFTPDGKAARLFEE